MKSPFLNLVFHCSEFGGVTNKDILKITFLKTNTPYPSRKIRRISACTHQRPQRIKAQYAISRETQYAIFKIWNQYNILEDIKRGPYSKKYPIRRCIQEMSQSLSSNVPDNSPEQEAATGHSIPRRLDSPTSQATQLPELELTLTPATWRELSQEINNHSVPILISQAPGPSQKRSRSPSSPFFLDTTTFSDGKPAFETSELNPEDVTARLEDIEIRADDAENRRAEDHEQIQIILARLGL
ncbi:hypothetical protein Tco_0540928 [Tanacetum coccineum]